MTGYTFFLLLFDKNQPRGIFRIQSIIHDGGFYGKIVNEEKMHVVISDKFMVSQELFISSKYQNIISVAG